jgi:Family of unknown function (DUF6345)
MTTEARPTQVPPQSLGGVPVFQPGAPLQNPFEGGVAGVRGGAKMYGAFSIQTFCDQGSLSHTHEDADGWYNYVKQFAVPNFWYKDAGVRVWAYYENYDNWQDTYGMDAVRAVYHSGHGGMDGNGVFYVPMGADWGGLGCTAISSNMRLGNETVRYVFWSTCLSLRIKDGQNPIKTWDAANLGLRMIFGFETVSWDSADYGKNFWQKWNGNGNRLGTAWLDASWAIAQDQEPSVSACGATAAEAQDRVFNEQYLYAASVSKNWWWWRWYNAARSMREPQRVLPRELLIAQLQPAAVRVQSARALADRFEIDMALPAEIPVRADGSFAASAGERTISYNADGSMDVRLTQPNLNNRNAILASRARTVVEEAVRRYGLDRDGALVPDCVRISNAAGGTGAGSGQLEAPYTVETTIQFRQVINGLPVITPDAGAVRVSVDNDGRVTSIHSSVRPIERTSDRARTMTPAPPTPRAADEPTPGDQTPEPMSRGGYEEALSAAFAKRIAGWAVSGRMPVATETVPGSTEIGYDIQGDEAVIIARKAVEVDFGGGYRKRYWVQTPLFE